MKIRRVDELIDNWIVEADHNMPSRNKSPISLLCKAKGNQYETATAALTPRSGDSDDYWW